MSKKTNKKVKSDSNGKKHVVSVKPKAVKKPKFKLISYTMKAVIPVGQYANIQPEVTVEAESIEAAERAVMPYIETLFAKYRDGGVKPIEPTVVRPVAPTNTGPTAPVAQRVGPVATPTVPKPPVTAPVATPAPVPAPVAVAPVIPLTVPFNRAKGAIESCTSLDALRLVSDQVEKSTKLIDTEKVELKKLVTAKHEQLNGNKKS